MQHTHTQHTHTHTHTQNTQHLHDWVHLPLVQGTIHIKRDDSYDPLAAVAETARDRDVPSNEEAAATPFDGELPLKV